jgi:hypothetical protein
MRGGLVNAERYCTHAHCRAHAAEELQFIAHRLRRPELIVKAAIVALTKHVPRGGPPFLREDFSTVAKATS